MAMIASLAQENWHHAALHNVTKQLMDISKAFNKILSFKV
jgi:hypothetical protein